MDLVVSPPPIPAGEYVPTADQRIVMYGVSWALSAYGPWTLKKKIKKSGVEPDECYLVGLDQSGKTPHLAIEVIWTSGGIGTLDIYARLGVGEVWFWKAGRIEIHLLRGDRYEPASRSALFPELDLDLLVSFLDRPTLTQAMRAYREALGR